MGLFSGNPSEQARAEMEEAAQRADNKSPDEFQKELQEQTGDEKFARTYRSRGRLYDKIPFSLQTMNVIIIVVAALIVLLIIIGMIIGQ